MLQKETDDLKLELAVRLEEIRHNEEELVQNQKKTLELEKEIDRLTLQSAVQKPSEDQNELISKLQSRLAEMEKETDILYHRIETLQEVQPGVAQSTEQLHLELARAHKQIEEQQQELKTMHSREEELGWIGEMKEILNLLELYKSEINRLEGELIEKSKVASKFQELKEEELEALKVRYNDLVDCYNELEESFSNRFRQLRKDVLRICPEKSLLIEKAFEESMEAPQTRVPKDHPTVMEERAEDE